MRCFGCGNDFDDADKLTGGGEEAYCGQKCLDKYGGVAASYRTQEQDRKPQSEQTPVEMPDFNYLGM